MKSIIERVAGAIAVFAALASLTACRSSVSPGENDVSELFRFDPAKVSFSDNQGTSCSDLVAITGDLTNFQGIGAEHAWLERRYPGFSKEGAGLHDCQNDRVVDAIQIRTRDERALTVLFDITAFYGKM